MKKLYLTYRKLKHVTDCVSNGASTKLSSQLVMENSDVELVLPIDKTTLTKPVKLYYMGFIRLKEKILPLVPFFFPIIREDKPGGK
jgi:hypothetical protein